MIIERRIADTAAQERPESPPYTSCIPARTTVPETHKAAKSESAIERGTPARLL